MNSKNEKQESIKDTDNSSRLWILRLEKDITQVLIRLPIRTVSRQSIHRSTVSDHKDRTTPPIEGRFLLQPIL